MRFKVGEEAKKEEGLEDWEVISKGQTIAGVELEKLAIKPDIMEKAEALLDNKTGIKKFSDRVVYHLSPKPGEFLIFSTNKLKNINDSLDLTNHEEYLLGFVLMAEQQISDKDIRKKIDADTSGYEPGDSLKKLLAKLKSLGIDEKNLYYKRLDAIRQLWEKRRAGKVSDTELNALEGEDSDIDE